MEFKDQRHGKVFGTLNEHGKEEELPKRIRNGSKRGIWQYEILGSDVALDNNLSYTIEDMKAYKTNL